MKGGGAKPPKRKKNITRETNNCVTTATDYSVSFIVQPVSTG